MPFEKGHPYYQSGGASSASRRLRVSLASVVRERNDPNEICAWLECIRDGYDPADPKRDVVTVDLKTRMEAQRMLLERGWGQPAQHTVIEGLIRSEQFVGTDTQRPKLTIAEINAKRQALRELLPVKQLQPAIIDADATEKPDAG